MMGSRRLVSLAAVLIAGIVLGLLLVVPAPADRAVVTVARFGDAVTLLPARTSLSFLPLASRVTVPRRDGRAVLEAEVRLPLAGGASAPARLRLHLAGAGRLPLAAGTVRAQGWDAAWRTWTAERVVLSPAESDAAVRASAAWRDIFPGDAANGAPDLVARLAPVLAPLALERAELELPADAAIVRAAARARLSDVRAPAGRLVLVGLDALDWQLVDELVSRGVMPNLARLLPRGAQAVLDVPTPLISPVVWTTLGTGVPPEQHGVLDFLEPDPDGGPPHPVSAASRKAPALWEMAAAAGRSSAVIGWWATFPAQAAAGGAVYSDRLTEQLLGLSKPLPGLADPPAAEAAARALAVRAQDVTAAMLAPLLPVGDDELRAALAKPNAWDDPLGGLAKLMAASLTVERLTTHELERGTQVVMTYLEGTDTVGHLFAAHRPPALPTVSAAEAARFGGVVDRYHAWVDAWIGRVLAALSPRDTLVIVSDHGFTWGAERPRVPAGAHTATAVMWHRPEGFFFAAGPGVAPSPARRRLHAFDVGPSVLALAGLPVGAEMPGEVPDWLVPSAPATVRWASLMEPRAAARVELPPEAREEELAKLRALGYLAGGEQPSAAAASPAAPAPAGPPATPAFNRAEARRLNNLAISRASAGDKAGAEQAFRQSMNADPTYSSPYYSLSIMLRNAGKLEEADALFWRSVELGVRQRELAVVQLALDYREKGMPDRARAVLAEGRRRLPEAATIWLNSGVFAGEHGDVVAAREYLERAAVLDPTNPAAHRNLAAARDATGDREGARRALTRAAELAPDDDATRRQLESLGGPLR